MKEGYDTYDSEAEKEGALEYSEYHEEEKELLKKLEDIDGLREETTMKLRKMEEQVKKLSSILELGQKRKNLLSPEDESSVIRTKAGVEQNIKIAQEVLALLEKQKSDLEENVETLREMRVAAESILEDGAKDKMH